MTISIIVIMHFCNHFGRNYNLFIPKELFSLFQTYYRGEVNIDQKTPEYENYKRYEYPHIFGSRVNRGDEELAKSKFPSMLGIVEDESDLEGGSRCFSQQSSVVSQWEDRVLSGDEDTASAKKSFNNVTVKQDSKEEDGFNFHDMSKAIPENVRQPNPNWSPGMVNQAPLVENTYILGHNGRGDSPLINELVIEAKRNEKDSPKIRKNIVQLEAINGHHPSRPQPIRKASSWAVAAGGVQNIGSMIPEKDNLDCNEPNFYLMKSSDSSEVSDPNLCDKLNEPSEDQTFKNCSEESDEKFKKCTNNGWSDNIELRLEPEEQLYGEDRNGIDTGKETNVHETKNGESRMNGKAVEDDFSFDPAIKDINQINKSQQDQIMKENHDFSPDKSAEFFLKSLMKGDEVTYNQSSVAPIWILPPDEQQEKKKSRKKKKPRA